MIIITRVTALHIHEILSSINTATCFRLPDEVWSIRVCSSSKLQSRTSRTIILHVCIVLIIIRILDSKCRCRTFDSKVISYSDSITEGGSLTCTNYKCTCGCKFTNSEVWCSRDSRSNTSNVCITRSYRLSCIVCSACNTSKSCIVYNTRKCSFKLLCSYNTSNICTTVDLKISINSSTYSRCRELKCIIIIQICFCICFERCTKFSCSCSDVYTIRTSVGQIESTIKVFINYMESSCTAVSAPEDITIIITTNSSKPCSSRRVVSKGVSIT